MHASTNVAKAVRETANIWSKDQINLARPSRSRAFNWSGHQNGRTKNLILGIQKAAVAKAGANGKAE